VITITALTQEEVANKAAIEIIVKPNTSKASLAASASA